MRNDIGTHYMLSGDDISATGTTAASTAVDHSVGSSASFYIICTSVGTSLDAKVQHSPDNSTWTDDDGASGNDTAITQIVAAGNAQLNVPNPQARYSRVLCTAVGAVVGTATSVVGPLRHVIPA